jgi:SAM-dependent methyltransferase
MPTTIASPSPNPKFEALACASHKTARPGRSQIARKLVQQRTLSKLRVSSILDFGCGYGDDVTFYREQGYKAEGFDTAPKSKWKRPDGQFDLVIANYIINVLPSVDYRLAAIRDAASFVWPGGYLLVAARSERTVRVEADRGGWGRFGDGWISSERKQTFQKGIGRDEIVWLLGAAGINVSECPLKLDSSACWVLGRKSVRGSSEPARRSPDPRRLETPGSRS